MTLRACVLSICLALPLAPCAPALAQTTLGAPANMHVVINGMALSPAQINQLIAHYGQVYPGRYWYDPISGLYGDEGGPPLGQGAPGVAMGGPLQPSASGGGDGTLTGAFINGREIHPDEYRYYQSIFGVVYPGRFWMSPDGTIGYENGPAIASVAQAAGASGGGGFTMGMQGTTARDNAVFGGDGSGCYYYGGNSGTSWSNC
ncbi:MAG: hypothetical protein MI723_13130 [Caulobacterales bacterium]|nr:hypothetical protein [Caulobacterales bacterium]